MPTGETENISSSPRAGWRSFNTLLSICDRVCFIVEPVSKRFSLFKVKKGDNFNRRNT